VLVFSLRRGESFYVGDQRVKLIDFDGNRAVMRTLGRNFFCYNEPEPLPDTADVRVSAGQRQESAIRIGIEAPMRIKILRERLYRRTHRDGQLDRKEPNRFYAKAMSCRSCHGSMKVKMHDGIWVSCPALQDQALPICDPTD